ncbi:MAG: recombinase family protein, partial [Ruminococcus sp.]|nr:recombinase family protein [Ruminococcus sp.]
MMRNNLLNFAEFERETIAARVADAYSTRGRETGFYQGGNMNFGYAPERMTINGKTGSVLVPSEQADALRLAYEMYADASTSLRDIIKYFREHEDEIRFKRTDKFGGKKGEHNGKLNISSLSAILANPLYVRADKDVYSFFQSKGYEILDDVSAYDGVHGVFIHDNADGGKYVKVGYHEGLVDSELWLAVQDKKSRNVTVPKNSKVANSWLVGLVKCAHCGYSVTFDRQFRKNNRVHRYLVDYGWITTKGCIARSFKLRTLDL